jgi:hypothetical protein
MAVASLMLIAQVISVVLMWWKSTRKKRTASSSGSPELICGSVSRRYRSQLVHIPERLAKIAVVFSVKPCGRVTNRGRLGSE